ncbi:MAG: hypothetical protein U1B30_08095 [Pseudomonadota bacterium]|nr:hypothetical protein [Pseudomonadota bacterium]
MHATLPLLQLTQFPALRRHTSRLHDILSAYRYEQVIHIADNSHGCTAGQGSSGT